MDHDHISPHEFCTQHSGLVSDLKSHDRRLGAHDKEIKNMKRLFVGILLTMVTILGGLAANLFILITRLSASG